MTPQVERLKAELVVQRTGLLRAESHNKAITNELAITQRCAS